MHDRATRTRAYMVCPFDANWARPSDVLRRPMAALARQIVGDLENSVSIYAVGILGRSKWRETIRNETIHGLVNLSGSDTMRP